MASQVAFMAIMLQGVVFAAATAADHAMRVSEGIAAAGKQPCVHSSCECCAVLQLG